MLCIITTYTHTLTEYGSVEIFTFMKCSTYHVWVYKLLITTELACSKTWCPALPLVFQDGRWKKASLMSLLKPPVFQVGRGDPPQTPICNLNIALPDNIQPEPAPSEPDLLALEKKYSFLSISE